MALESQFLSVADLNASNPASSDLLSEADDHLRGIKNVFVTQFGSLGSTALTVTAAHLNQTISTAADSVVSGSLTFADENHGLKWDLSGSTPVWATPLTLTAFTMADPYTPGNPTVAGLGFNVPICQVNNPVMPGVTSGFQIYFRTDDGSPAAGFELIDEVDGAQAGGFVVLDTTGGAANLAVQALKGELWFLDTVANSGLAISLDDIWSLLKNLETRVIALEGA